MTNTFNVLDLLLPEMSASKPLASVTPEPKKRPFQYTDEEIKYEFKLLEDDINNLEDLIKLGKKYESVFKPMKKKFNLNIRVLSEMVPHLEELNNMVGMKNIKDAIFDKIILFLQGLDDNPNDYHHIVLYGGPGMGKTVVAKIIGKIYAKMGLLSKGDFKEISLTDLKGGYIGQSEIKTQKMLDESKGCVVFMDEAYSLGSEDKIDSYSQGIIDLINPYLDKFRNDFIFIIAGYKKDLDSRFFRGNQGLKSRFGLWLEIEKYNADNLRDIFIKKVLDNKWFADDKEIPIDFFNENKEVFKFFGRDIENLFSKCKIAHAKRVLFSNPDEKKNITKQDLINGYNLYKNHIPDSTEKTNKNLAFMYT
jgi:SpoVK/Ycf46/Vps4 family AAA+-type ATPase